MVRILDMTGPQARVLGSITESFAATQEGGSLQELRHNVRQLVQATELAKDELQRRRRALGARLEQLQAGPYSLGPDNASVHP